VQYDFSNYFLYVILPLQTQITTDSSSRAKLQTEQILSQ
jgi:hypothetical protein